ncbi:DgyrCDS9769 [Dimorphilus gyrociliatus]|uniref:DgyrCDS9769 n=1 Tax=Dimorphilus gyrociliatus TaxID=2664684 RepID=A0A7I8VYC1_9ANNE|nr:DgyrCDS9769 [Dimorphilus gyrociliatus]
MKIVFVLILVCTIDVIVGPPVQPDKKKAEEEEDPSMGLEYERYLKEVVNILESDEIFRKKLEGMNSTEIEHQEKFLIYNSYLQDVFNVLMSDKPFNERLSKVKDIGKEAGDVAQHLELVSKGVRSKLDELKRQEIERLKIIAKLLKKNINQRDVKRYREKLIDLVEHLDHSNPTSFEEDDLRRLIKKATSDLSTIDKKRREEFKNYELEKETIRREKLKNLDENKRKEEEKAFEELQKKHKDHPKLHHPGSKDQLEEVWEKEDGLDKGDFDPKTFFNLHDKNSDGYLDEEEIEALFQRELDKVYNADQPEDDMIERFEEMNRMREHVMNEMDKDKDAMLSYNEFIEGTKKDEYKKDEGWNTLDEEKPFSEDELQDFMKEFEEKRKEKFEGHAQPGEVHVPVDPSAVPKPADHLEGDKKAPDVQHMEQPNPSLKEQH